MNIFISISNVSVITGHNKWKSKKDLIIDLWKRFDYINYINTKNSFDEKLKLSNQNKSIKESIKKNVKNISESININTEFKTALKLSLEKSVIDKSVKNDLIKKIDKSIDTKQNIKQLNVNNDIKKIIKKQIKNIKNNDNIDNQTIHDIQNNLKQSLLSNEKLNNKKNNDEMNKNINEISKIIEIETKKESLKRKINSCNELDTNSAECKKKFVKTETDSEKIKRIEKEKNININSKISVKSNNTKELNLKNDIIKKIDSTNLSDKEKEDVKKSVINESNKRYGTIRENFTVNYLRNIYDFDIVIDKSYKRKLINTINNKKFYLSGEIDGIYNNDTIIEIKNRTKRLFHRIYNYEKVQIVLYMYLWNMNKSKLVENYNNQINIIDSDLDSRFLDKILLELKHFSNFYYKLLHDIDYKRATLLSNDAEFNTFYKSCF